MRYTVSLCRDDSGWFASMTHLAPVRAPFVRWSATFTSPAHATSVLGVADSIARRLNAGEIAWRAVGLPRETITH